MNRRVLWRLAMIQGSWNYDRMVGLGLGFAALPLLPPATGHSDEALARLSAHFNAHPYLAGLAVGALARMERDGRPAVDVMRLRDALRGPLGSIGDELFWAGVLPTAAGIGLVAATQGPPWAGAVMLLGVHNLMHVPVRRWALNRGWELGREVARALGARWLARARVIATTTAPLAVGLAMAPALWWLVGGVGPRLGAAIVASAAVIAHRLAPTMGGVRIGILAALAALLGGGL
jgi:PTS system mannose-specific IID component